MNETNSISLSYKETHRSDFFASKVKHCFEAKLKSGCGYAHIGFIPNNYERNFVSYWKTNNDITYLLELISENQYKTQITNDASVGSTVMVCLDSEKSLFTSIINGKTNNRTYTNIKHSLTWYAFVDTDAYCGSSKQSFEVNLGMCNFVNAMPFGYKRFINAYYKNKYQLNISCRCKRLYSTIPFIYFILVASK